MLAGLAIVNLIVIAVLVSDPDEALITHDQTANAELVDLTDDYGA